MTIEQITPTSPRPIRRSMMSQRWVDLSFLHWPADPELVQRHLPPGTRPDLHEGVAYVGLIAFRMVGVGPGPRLGVPYLGTFAETNVRLYSVDGRGRRAVVFRSLDAARLLPVLVAQSVFRLPYKWSRMSLRRDGDVFTYTNHRRWPGPGRPRSRMVVRAGAPIAEPTPLEHFLSARWGLHVDAFGRTLHLPNVHPQWPLHRAELLELDDELVTAAGFPAPVDPPVSVLYSPGVPVRFGWPERTHRGFPQSVDRTPAGN